MVATRRQKQKQTPQPLTVKSKNSKRVYRNNKIKRDTQDNKSALPNRSIADCRSMLKFMRNMVEGNKILWLSLNMECDPAYTPQSMSFSFNREHWRRRKGDAE